VTSSERDRQHAHETAAAADLPRLVTVEEAAAALSVTPQTVYRRVEDGTIPAVRIGRAIRIDLDQALEQMRVEAGTRGAAGRSAAITRRPPAAREPQGAFARRARGLSEREPSTPGSSS